jgi:hypothetical protein
MPLCAPNRDRCATSLRRGMKRFGHVQVDDLFIIGEYHAIERIQDKLAQVVNVTRRKQLGWIRYCSLGLGRIHELQAHRQRRHRVKHGNLTHMMLAQSSDDGGKLGFRCGRGIVVALSDFTNGHSSLGNWFASDFKVYFVGGANKSGVFHCGKQNWLGLFWMLLHSSFFGWSAQDSGCGAGCHLAGSGTLSFGRPPPSHLLVVARESGGMAALQANTRVAILRQINRGNIVHDASPARGLGSVSKLEQIRIQSNTCIRD